MRPTHAFLAITIFGLSLGLIGCPGGSAHVQDRIAYEFGIPVTLENGLSDCDRVQLEKFENEYLSLSSADQKAAKERISSAIDSFVVGQTEVALNITGDYTYLTLQYNPNSYDNPTYYKEVGTKSLVDQRQWDGVEPVNTVTFSGSTLRLVTRTTHDMTVTRNFGTLDAKIFDTVETLDQLDLALRDGGARLIARSENDKYTCGQMLPLSALYH